MNREYLGLTIKNGSFVAKNAKIGDFSIQKDGIEELDACINGKVTSKVGGWVN